MSSSYDSRIKVCQLRPQHPNHQCPWKDRVYPILAGLKDETGPVSLQLHTSDRPQNSEFTISQTGFIWFTGARLFEGRISWKVGRLLVRGVHWWEAFIRHKASMGINTGYLFKIHSCLSFISSCFSANVSIRSRSDSCSSFIEHISSFCFSLCSLKIFTLCGRGENVMYW